ncbi:MAG: ComF family protein [Candidatus Delongbacteria bacterium]|nr:ComF family protein [Candidatus Delongbacteria bacterium]
MNISSIRDGLVSLIFFQRCYNCRTPLKAGEYFVCARCGRIDYFQDHNPLFVPECTYLDALHVIGRYQSAMEHAITEFKYHYNMSAYAFLKRILISRIALYDFTWVETVIPVPLFPAKQRQRGFNQSEMLAASVARSIARPMRRNLLGRTVNTQSQAGLNGHQRRINLTGAFQIVSPMSPNLRSILLIDDVVTTGSTANECAFTLKMQGVERVELLALATRLSTEP